MPSLPAITTIDSEQIFRDWGESVQFEEVVRHYDPATGETEEQVYSSSLCAIRQGDKLESVVAVSATLSLARRWYLVRRTDLPEGVPLTSARLVADETPYEIRSVMESQVPGILLLECVQGDACVP